MRKRNEQLTLFLGTNCPQITMVTESGKKVRSRLGCSKEHWLFLDK
ncbi:hypothetical protein [Prevotella sp.]